MQELDWDAFTVPVATEAASERNAAQRLLVAMPAVQVSEGEGGFSS